MERFDFDAVYKANRAEGRYGWHDRPLYEERVTRATAFLARNHARPGDTVLLLGCGAGHTLFALARAGFDISGVDIAPTAISWAKDQLAGSGLTADLRVGDVVTLESYLGGAFRFVLDDYCLQCVIGPDRATSFANVFRVLKPSGVFHAGADRASDRPGDAPESADFDARSRCLFRDDIPYSYLTVEDELEHELMDASFLIRHNEYRPKRGGPSYHAGRQWVDAVKPG